MHGIDPTSHTHPFQISRQFDILRCPMVLYYPCIDSFSFSIYFQNTSTWTSESTYINFNSERKYFWWWTRSNGTFLCTYVENSIITFVFQFFYMPNCMLIWNGWLKHPFKGEIGPAVTVIKEDICISINDLGSPWNSLTEITPQCIPWCIIRILLECRCLGRGTVICLTCHLTPASAQWTPTKGLLVIEWNLGGRDILSNHRGTSWDVMHIDNKPQCTTCNLKNKLCWVNEIEPAVWDRVEQTNGCRTQVDPALGPKARLIQGFYYWFHCCSAGAGMYLDCQITLIDRNKQVFLRNMSVRHWNFSTLKSKWF